MDCICKETGWDIAISIERDTEDTKYIHPIVVNPRKGLSILSIVLDQNKSIYFHIINTDAMFLEKKNVEGEKNLHKNIFLTIKIIIYKIFISHILSILLFKDNICYR